MKAIVIIGVTGDLSAKKLLPALWHGFYVGRFKKLKIIGLGRRSWASEEFLAFARNSCKPPSSMEAEWNEFSRLLEYCKADYESEELDALWPLLKGCKGVLYFLATPPEAFPLLAEKLSKFKPTGFRRLIVEKPFGKDLQTADKLNKETKRFFGENVYRIDHYLGKGIVRNILTLRFANEVFKDVWNKEHIQSVRIEHAETHGVENRREYYDSTGAIRDMVQSHLLQLLALVTMREPNMSKVFAKKVEVFSRLSPPKPRDVVRGQFSSYEKEVGRESDTESFAAVRAYVKMPEWKGVPFYLSTGKRLPEALAKITVTFKKTGFAHEAQPNTLEIMISPEEHVKFTFNLHNHDLGKIQPFSMDYCISCEFNPNTPSAYEKLISDALDGDKSLFATWAEIRAAWKYADKLSEAASKTTLHKYQDGSAGPVDEVKRIFLES